MNISRTSWHYRFMMKFANHETRYNLKNGSKPFTTCTYIREFVFAAVSLAAKVVWFFAAAAFALFLLYSMLHVGYLYFFAGGLPEVPTVTAVLGLIGVFAAGFGLTLFLALVLVGVIQRLWERSSHERRVKKRAKLAKKEASLMSQAMKDRKDGICTLVKFVD